ncbi:MAG: hypothetical protein ACI8SZ_002082, partial [Colwellia sp.]
KLKDNKIYHADIPKSRLDELLAQRNKTAKITLPESEKNPEPELDPENETVAELS